MTVDEIKRACAEAFARREAAGAKVDRDFADCKARFVAKMRDEGIPNQVIEAFVEGTIDPDLARARRELLTELGLPGGVAH